MTPPAPSKSLNVIILGGGIAGLTTALALTKFAPKDAPPPNISIYEIRPEPGTIGGAVNLTPNALRLLDHLGALQIMHERGYGLTINELQVFDIYSTQIAASSFRGANGEGLGDPPYKALRITRGDALKAVLAAIDQHPNIKMTCGKRTTSIHEDDDSVSITFEDGQTVSADLLMGCDGIHSVTRLKHVEPARQETYSGICNAFGFVGLDATTEKEIEVHFESTAINFARRGMLLTSFHSPKKDSVYMGALMQVPEIGSRDGWKAAGADADKTRKDILDRFGDAAIPCIKPLIDRTTDFYLWPVFTLSKGGKWATDRVMLLGDAAHAMPPQGESTGIVFEDAVLFARCIARWLEKSSGGTGTGGPRMKEAFDAYETLRRPRIDVAFEESKSVVRTVSDAGWVGHKIKTFVVPWYLWWTRTYRDKHFIEDTSTSELGY